MSKNKFALTSHIIGIISIIMLNSMHLAAFCFFIPIAGVVFGIISISDIKTLGGKGNMLSGIILSTISLITTMIYMIMFILKIS